MYCSKCGNMVDNDVKFCPNCGCSQISNKESIENGFCMNDKKDNKTKKFTLIRATIEYIILFVLFVTISYTRIVESVVGIIVLGVISVAVYLVLSIMLNKSIKLKKFHQYLFCNFFSLVLCFIISFITLNIFIDATKLYAEAGVGYAMLYIFLNIFIIPIMFTFNLVIDSIVVIINKYLKKV